MKQLECIQNAGMKCKEMAAASAAKYYGHNYEMMYMDFWGFEFLDVQKYGNKMIENEIIGDRLLIDSNDISRNLNKFHGIRRDRLQFKNPEECLETIIMYLNRGLTVSLNFDQFHMPWTLEKRRTPDLRYGGYLLLYDYDMEEEVFGCIDIHGDRGNEKLTVREFITACYGYEYIINSVYVYEIQKQEAEYTCSEQLRFLKEAIDRKNTNGKLFVHNIKEAANYIRKNFDFQKEINYTLEQNIKIIVPSRIIFVDNLIEIARMRNLFSITLDYINRNKISPELEDISSRFKLLYSDWRVLVSLLSKRFYKKDYADLNNLLADKFLQYWETEKALYYRIQNLSLESAQKNTLIEHRKENNIKNCVRLNIKNLFNNKGIFGKDTNVSDICSGFDGLGNCYIYDESLNHVLEDYKSDSEFDNVICNKQEIHFDRIKCRGISVVGSCESGTFIGELKVMLEESVEMNILVGFGEWRFVKCELNEVCVWEGDRNYLGEIKPDERGFLFKQEIHFPNSRDITSLILPDCKCMHIFDIQLF